MGYDLGVVRHFRKIDRITEGPRVVVLLNLPPEETQLITSRTRKSKSEALIHSEGSKRVLCIATTLMFGLARRHRTSPRCTHLVLSCGIAIALASVLGAEVVLRPPRLFDAYSRFPSRRASERGDNSHARIGSFQAPSTGVFASFFIQIEKMEPFSGVTRPGNETGVHVAAWSAIEQP